MTKEDLINLKKQISELSEEEKKRRDLYLRELALGELQGPPTGYASIDKPWLKYYSENDLMVDIPKVSPYELFKDVCKKNANSIALTYMPKEDLEINITFKQELNKINELANCLLNSKTDDNEIVLAILPNFPESKELLFSCIASNIIFFPFNPLLPVSFLNDILKQYNIKNFFIFNGFVEKYYSALKENENKLNNIIHIEGIESLPDYLINFKKISDKLTGKYVKPIVFDSKKSVGYKEFINKYKKIKPKFLRKEYNEDDALIIESTSGTTGIPKGVVLSGKNINTTVIEQLYGAIDNSVGDKYLDIMNNSLAYGAIAAIASSIAGMRTYFSPGFTMDAYDIIKEKNIDLMVGGPVHCENLLSHKENNEEMPIIKNWISGGAPLSFETERKINCIDEECTLGSLVDENKVIVRQGYGATENEGVITYQKKGAYKFGSVGIPLSKSTVAIFNPNSFEELTYNNSGEIAISGPSIMSGYYNNPSESNKVLIRHDDGTLWLHLKDLGYMDSDGNLFFVDRIKNIFGRNGMNVHPKTIDNCISQMNNVEMSVTIGVKHPDEQMVPVTFIKLKNSSVDLETQLNYINENCYKYLEESSIPYEIIFVDNIPLNGGGKPDLNYLIESSNIDYYKNNGGRKRKLGVENINPFRI